MHVSFVTKHTELWHLRAIYLMLLGPNHLLGPISWKIASEMTKNPSLKRFRWLSILADNLHFNTLIFLYILSFEKKYVIAKQLWLELGYVNFCNIFMSNFGYNNHSTLFLIIGSISTNQFFKFSKCIVFYLVLVHTLLVAGQGHKKYVNLKVTTNDKLVERCFCSANMGPFGRIWSWHFLDSILKLTTRVN